MTRNDLTKGLVFQTRDGRVRFVTDNGTIYNLKKGTVACLITDYNDDLTSKVDPKFDVVAVYNGYKMGDPIWTRPEPQAEADTQADVQNLKDLASEIADVLAKYIA